ncbi:MAG: hypothetical protein PT120_00785 [Aphanizomenon gracile PMC649.10]|nr:hypothetical protein [Aphanizomenon gracile PMC649.10]
MCNCAELSVKGDSEALRRNRKAPRRNRSLLVNGGRSAIALRHIAKHLSGTPQMQRLLV